MSTVPLKTGAASGGGGLPAARLSDMHICPAHIGGTIMPPCSPTVFIEGLSAARVDDLCQCLIGPPDPINKGSATVFINGKKAARLGDTTAHGGVINLGAARTFIGDGAGAGAAGDCMKDAAASGHAVVVLS